MKLAIITLAASILSLTCSSCMQQTVRDARGDIIYQEPVVGTPWQSEKKTQKNIAEREAELGWR